MTLSIKILSRGFAFLLTQLLLLLFDPAQFVERKDTNRIQLHAQGRGNPHRAGWRINAQMNILY